MKKLLFVFTVLVVAAAACAAYSLILLDKIVHGTLYNYGLKFSYDWANPYWTLLRIVQAMIALAAVFNVVSSVYVYRKYIYTKPRVPLVRSEKSEKKIISSPISPPISSPIPKPEMPSETPSETPKMGGLVKCTHCNKVFAQPLRMLDFHSDRPRIVNICPFCNEVIPPILHSEEEREKKSFLKGKKNNRTKESEETIVTTP
jgi:hypothetical protein